MKFTITSITILFLSIKLIGQTDTNKKLIGTWILCGVQEETYQKFNTNFPIFNVEKDSALTLYISNNEFKIISIRYSKHDTTIYTYKITGDSASDPFIALKSTNKSRKRNRKEDPFGMRGVFISNLNNKYLTLVNLHNQSNSFFLAPYNFTSNYYFKKVIDSTQIIDEMKLACTWFSLLGNKFSFESDTLRLSKDTIYVDNNDGKTQFSLEFMFDSNISDKVRIRREASWGMMARVTSFSSYLETWEINAKDKILEIKFDAGNIYKYYYWFTDRTLVLVSKKNN